MTLLTPKQVSEMLAISESQLRALTDEGSISFVNIGLGLKRATRRYEPHEVEAFIQRRRTTAVAPFQDAPRRRQRSFLQEGYANLGDVRAELERRKRAKKERT